MQALPIQTAIALHRAGRLDEADEQFRLIIESGNEVEHALMGRALIRFETGRLEESVELLRQALSRTANAAPVHFMLARVYEQLCQHDDAVESFKKSLALKPTQRDVLHAFRDLLRRLDRSAEFREWIEKAIASEPKNALLLEMIAQHDLAFGDFGNAQTALEDAVVLEPRDGSLYMALMEVRRLAPDDPHVATMERMVGSSLELPIAERIDFLFALAKAYESMGNKEKSFNCLLDANRLMRTTFQYNEAGILSQYKLVQEQFPAEFISRNTRRGDPSTRPIFVIGMPRSGSTLVEQILSSHPEVYGAGENPDFLDVVSKTVRDYQDILRLGESEGFAKLGADYLKRKDFAARGAPYFIDKTLSNDYFVGLIHLALPNAKFVHVVRNAVNCCLSIFSKHFGAEQMYSYDLGELGRYYRAKRKLMEHWCRVLPENAIIEVKYEDLVENLEGETRRILEFCGIPFDAACLSFDKTPRPIWTVSATQVRQPIFRSSLHRWRPDETKLKPLIDGLGEFAIQS